MRLLLRGLAKEFAFADGRPPTVALGGIDLTVEPDQYVCIVGPSGCGKSTLLSLAAGLGAPTAGTVHYEISGPAPARVGFVFQDFALFPWRTTAANIAFGLEELRLPRSQIEERVTRYLELCELVGFEHHYPRQLSGGMRQRVGLARALAVDPGLLLLDEPFSALDVQTRSLLHEQLLKIWEKEPRTTLHVTHDIAEAITFADRVIVLTRRPAQISDDIPINLARPRGAELVSDPEFRRLHSRIWNQIRDSAAAALRDGSSE